MWSLLLWEQLSSHPWNHLEIYPCWIHQQFYPEKEEENINIYELSFLIIYYAKGLKLQVYILLLEILVKKKRREGTNICFSVFAFDTQTWTNVTLIHCWGSCSQQTYQSDLTLLFWRNRGDLSCVRINNKKIIKGYKIGSRFL